MTFSFDLRSVSTVCCDLKQRPNHGRNIKDVFTSAKQDSVDKNYFSSNLNHYIILLYLQKQICCQQTVQNVLSTERLTSNSEE